jgi:serine/threonine protein kinase
VNSKIENLLPARYHLLELLQAAAHRQVYLGHDETNQTLVIIKCFTMSAENAYLRETAAAFGVQHPNIARCLDTLYLGEGCGCLIYEYLTGGTLRTLFNSNPLKSKIFFYCLRDILRALQYMHHLGMIHCDIKPENILLRPQPNKDIPQFVLSDLGAAAFVREAKMGKMLPASPAYIAPERLYEKYSFSSDLYSVGILGFEMLTGQRPFSGTTDEIFSAHLSTPPPLEMISHPQLREFIGQLLEKNPEDRLGDANLALKLLFNLAQGKSLIEKPIFELPTPNESTDHLKFNTQQLKHCQTLIIKQPVQQILALENQIGIGFEHHWEIFEENISILTLFNTAKIQSNGQQLTYSNQGKIYSLNINNRQRYCLCSNCQGVKAFEARGKYLVWSAGQRVFWMDLHTQKETYHRTENYLLEPKICVLNNGDFATNEGYMGHRVALRDSDVNLLNSWELNGPVINLQYDGQTILALALDVHSQASYCLYRLEQQQSSTCLQLPPNLVHICYVSGRFFWLMPDGELFWSNKDLEIHSSGRLLEHQDIEQFHISANLRWFVTLQKHEQHSIIMLWEHLGNNNHDTAN